MANTVDWKVLTDYLIKKEPNPDFATKLFMTNVHYSPVPKVTLRDVQVAVTASPLRSVYAPATNANLQFGFNETTLTPPQIFEKQSITEELLLSQVTDPSILVGTATTVEQNKLFIFADAVERLKKRVLNRIELMCGQILGQGKIQYDDGSFQYTVEYVTPRQAQIGRDDNIIMILKEMVQSMKEKGFAPDYIIVSPDVEAWLWENKYFNKAVERSAYAIGQVNLDAQPYVSYVAKLPGLPDIVSYAAQIGTERTFPATKRIVLVSKEAVGLAFGAVINAHLSEDMVPKQGPMFAFQIPSVDGTNIDVAVISRPLPYVIGKEGLAIYDVTIS